MKKNLSVMTLTILLAGFFLSACSFGFEPAWKKDDGKATVTLQFKSLSDSEGLSVPRAIVQGAGYLYIRTIGGPTGSDGPFYGPFPFPPARSSRRRSYRPAATTAWVFSTLPTSLTRRLRLPPALPATPSTN